MVRQQVIAHIADVLFGARLVPPTGAEDATNRDGTGSHILRRGTERRYFGLGT